MNAAMTFMTAAAGLIFSLSCAVLIEEIFVGSFFRLFFAPKPATQKADR